MNVFARAGFEVDLLFFKVLYLLLSFPFVASAFTLMTNKQIKNSNMRFIFTSIKLYYRSCFINLIFKFHELIITLCHVLRLLLICFLCYCYKGKSQVLSAQSA